MIIQKVDPIYIQVFEKLKEEITTGKINAGEQLVDTWIAKKWNVSRSPVREAFRKLEQAGLVINNGGTLTVYQPNLEDVIELFQVRAGLEGQAAFLGAALITDKQLEELNDSLLSVEKAIKEKRVEDIVKLNTFFHEFIIKICNNERLNKFMNEVNALTLIYRNNSSSKDYEKGFENKVFLNEHYEIYEALKKHDSKLASEKMQNHILHDLEYLKERYSAEKEVRI